MISSDIPPRILLENPLGISFLMSPMSSFLKFVENIFHGLLQSFLNNFLQSLHLEHHPEITKFSSKFLHLFFLRNIILGNRSRILLEMLSTIFLRKSELVSDFFFKDFFKSFSKVSFKFFLGFLLNFFLEIPSKIPQI